MSDPTARITCVKNRCFGPSQIIKKSRTTNYELANICKKFNLPLNNIVSKNELERIQPIEGAYIINLQSSDEGRGTHWLALALVDEARSRKAFYFDSFGVPPPIDVINFCNRFGARDIIISKKEIQNINGGGCGSYCVYFLTHMFNKTHPIKKKGDGTKLFNSFLTLFQEYC